MGCYCKFEPNMSLWYILTVGRVPVNRAISKHSRKLKHDFWLLWSTSHCLIGLAKRTWLVPKSPDPSSVMTKIVQFLRCLFRNYPETLDSVNHLDSMTPPLASTAILTGWVQSLEQKDSKSICFSQPNTLLGTYPGQ